MPRPPLPGLQEQVHSAKVRLEVRIDHLRAELDCIQRHAHDLAALCVSHDSVNSVQVSSSLATASCVSTETQDETPQEFSDQSKLHAELALGGVETSSCALEESQDDLACRKQLSSAVRQPTQSFGTAGRTEADLEKFDSWTAWLNVIPALVIVVNALVIGVSLDLYRGHIGWQIMEYVFVGFYSLEFVLKVWAYGWQWYICGPDRAWNWFDLACLVFMYVDVTVATLLLLQGHDDSEAEAISSLNLMKIFRLARLARLIRALRFRVFHELKLIVLGVFSGLRVICWAIVLLVVLVYGIGVAMRNFVGEEHEEFETVVAAMFTCFRCFTDGCSAYDGTPLSEHLRKSQGGIFIVAYIFVIMLVTVGIFNLIMAVFIENVMSSQFVRKQTEISETALMMETKIKDRIIQKLGLKRSSFRASPDLRTRSAGLDGVLQVGGRNISREEFDLWLRDADFVRVLDEASIDVSANIGLFDVLDADGGGELSINELVTGLMSLRGPVTKGDVIGMSLKVRYLVGMMEASQQGLSI
mmetsp:Transcript_3660/g.8518  ORF Transcript_3660/g.8518 Transcript_3660/m.8518 type:complete len:528 (-) Transcript_3660:276-1859(-)